MPLTDKQVLNARPSAKPVKMFDERGLYLEISPTGGKWWRLKYRINGKEKRISLGVYPEVGLKDARTRRDIARKQIENGIDPSQQRKAEHSAHAAQQASTFEALAREWHTNRLNRWTPENAVRILRRMELYLFPEIGAVPVAALTSRRVLATLKKIEQAGKLETARRCLQYITGTLRYAAHNELITTVVTDLLGRDALTAPSERNHNRVKPNEIGALLRAIDAAELRPTTRLGLALVFLTAVRTGEARAARWHEFDLEAGRWTIPAERMKMSAAHIVPLSKQALAVLHELHQHTGNRELLFPNQARPLQPMSENTLLYALNRAGYSGRQTVHGIRGLFSTTANESGKWEADVIELCLAHQNGNAVRRAYNSAQRLPDRARLLQWWADHLDSARAGAEIIQFKKAV